MKKTINILLVATLIIFTGCSSGNKKTKRINRPSHLPTNVPNNWGPYEQKAYEEERLHYVKDSTACYIDGERPMTPDHIEESKQNPNSVIIESIP
jgi:hypothetical protein